MMASICCYSMVKTTNPNIHTSSGSSFSSTMAEASPTPPITEATINPSQDTASPFYIDPSENPTSFLVSPVLSGNNYHSWSRAFSTAVISKNKQGFLTGSISSPPADDPSFPAWERCNSLVLSWLFQSLSPSIKQSVIFHSTASSVWEELRERFSHTDLLRIDELQEEFYNSKQGTSSVTDFYTSINTLWEELENFRPLPICNCPGKSYRSQDLIIRFLKGLDDRFSVIRSQILLLDPLPPVSRVFAMVIQRERQLLFTNANPGEQKSFAAAFDSRKRQSSRNPSSPSSGGTRGSNSSKVCTFCGRTGHTVDVCYGKHGYPPGHPRYPGRPNLPERGAVTAHAAAVADPPPPSSSCSLTQRDGNELGALTLRTQFWA